MARHGCGQDVPDKYVRMDLGGELGLCPEIVGDLGWLCTFGCHVYTVPK
jgi:hypothetical protein